MKKYIPLVIIAALSLCSCVKSLHGVEDAVEGKIYTFQGSVDSEGFVWSSTSEIGVYGLTEGAVAKNVRCKIDGWGYEPPVTKEEEYAAYTPSPYEGKETAPFYTPEIYLPAGVNEFLVTNPYDKGLTYVPSQRTIFDYQIPSGQTCSKPGELPNINAIGVVKGNTDESSLSFKLSPVSALVKVNISSDEFAGYKIKKVSIAENSGKGHVSGMIDFNIDTFESTVTSFNAFANITVSSPEEIVSGQTQSFYIRTLEYDCTGMEFIVTVTMANETTNVTLPVKAAGVNMKIGQVAEINITDLKSTDNCVGKWFCPVESRQMVGAGYAYGQANTFLIQCKSEVFKGATLSVNDDIPESVVIDYRLRGDYSVGTAPEGVTFEWATTAGGSKLYGPRDDNKIVFDGYSFVHDPVNYTVTVKNESATGGAPILLMKKGDQILWGWTFWNIAADGTAIEPVTIGGYEYCNLAIGIPTTDNVTWTKQCGNQSRTIYYYQWGRYLPVFWNTVLSLNWVASAEGQEAATRVANVRAINGPYKTLLESLSQPAGIVQHIGSDVTEDWLLEDGSALWGGNAADSGAEGTKSIYDPCPKGWRVPDYGTAKDLAAQSFEYDQTSSRMGATIGGSFFGLYGELDGSKNVATATTSMGGYQIQGSWTAGRPASYWTNFCESGAVTASYFAIGAPSSEDTMGLKIMEGNKAICFPVRCQKDNYNR